MLQHTIRNTTSLNGLWDFTFLEEFELSSFSPERIRYDRKLPVPAAFDTFPGLQGKRGTGVYRSYLETPENHRFRILFEAVSMWSQVWINGQCLAENRCGYAPFSIDFTPNSKQTEIVVLSDNRYDFDRTPMHQEYFDFYQHGGIIRNVTLHRLPEDKPTFTQVFVCPTHEYREGKVRLSFQLDSSPSSDMCAEIYVDNRKVGSTKLSPGKNATTMHELTVPDPKIWSPNHPALHELHLELIDANGQAFDNANCRFGLRQVKAEDGKLWLNGEPLELIGYNRHEWHPNYGPSTPPLQMALDLELLKDLGCNFVRGCHYHQDQQFLNLCDELGILVWEENLGWQQKEESFKSQRYCEDHQKALESMFAISCNHPSIIIWGFLNEAASQEAFARPLIEQSVNTLKSLDDSRLVTFASNRPYDDQMFDLVDFISLNLYPGWYGAEDVDDPLSLIGPEFDKILTALEEKGLSHKPVIISEIGVEGLYGWHDPYEGFFTETFQANYLEAAIREVFARRFSGIALWHFSDARTYNLGWALKRPRAFNNKGTLDEYRRPKLAYARVQSAFKKLIH